MSFWISWYSTRVIFYWRFCSMLFGSCLCLFVFAKWFFFLWVLVTSNVLSIPPFSFSFYFSQPEVVVPITVASAKLFHLVLRYVSLGSKNSKGKISVAEGKHFGTNYTCKWLIFSLGLPVFLCHTPALPIQYILVCMYLFSRRTLVWCLHGF